MVSCGQKTFSSSKKLASHVNNDHVKEPRLCIFKNCDKTFNPNATSTLRTHFRSKHFDVGQTDLKDVHIMASVPTNRLVHPGMNESVEDEVLEVDEEEQFHEEEEEDTVETDNNEEETIDERDFMMAYADFINRLINYRFIQISSVKIIAAEYLQQAHQSAKSREIVLRQSLSKIPNLSPEVNILYRDQN